MSFATDRREKTRVEQTSIEPHSNASSNGWHDEEKDHHHVSRQSSDAHDADILHDLNTIETQSLAGSQLPPPPDGGMHAWLKVFGGFLVYINIWYGVRTSKY